MFPADCLGWEESSIAGAEQNLVAVAEGKVQFAVAVKIGGQGDGITTIQQLFRKILYTPTDRYKLQ